LRPEATDREEIIPSGIAFRSIGYIGVPVPGVPFKQSWGVILNQDGRVIDPESQKPMTGLYTAGWIKRGASGVIGTNKPDAAETVDAMIDDLAAGKTLQPADPSPEVALALVAERKPAYFTYDDWLRLDEIELRRGEEQGRPRVKFTDVDAMLEALEKQAA
jgi:ferredoxin--NADP+ reductase